ncbi:hypothetical protein [Allokutzneria oryzae]|uniref:Uncharacterized protein n=1 Tax=Allokutzneria oryzae TaxID=1378989 RepID=A0ABV5ZX69_9PSEU
MSRSTSSLRWPQYRIFPVARPSAASMSKTRHQAGSREPGLR